MSSAEELVTDAYRLLGEVDINEEAPSPAVMTRGLRRLSQMIAAWAGEGLAVADQTLTGTTEDDSAVITDLSSTAALAPGMNVSGTGVSARILTVDSPTQITLDADATASGSVSLAFTIFPLQQKFEEGVAAMLAVKLAPLIGEDNIPGVVLAEAKAGWDLLVGNFYRVPAASYDAGLLSTSVRRNGF